MQPLIEQLKDVNEGAILFCKDEELPQPKESEEAWSGSGFRCCKYSSGVYGIPFVGSRGTAILRLASARPKARFRELLADCGAKPWESPTMSSQTG